MCSNELVSLAPRLMGIAEQVPEQARIADIGTDHAHLPIWLIENGRIDRAIASDIRQGPLDRARENVEAHHMSDRVSLRLGAGLEKVEPSECDTIIIAGMGGETISDILLDAQWTFTGQHLLLLQPMTMIAELRQFLWKNGFEIIKETIRFEERHSYVVMTVKGSGNRHEEPISACHVSSALLKAEGAKDYLLRILKREQRILDGLLRAETDVKEKIDMQRAVVKNIENGLEALQ